MRWSTCVVVWTLQMVHSPVETLVLMMSSPVNTNAPVVFPLWQIEGDHIWEYRYGFEISQDWKFDLSQPVHWCMLVLHSSPGSQNVFWTVCNFSQQHVVVVNLMHRNKNAESLLKLQLKPQIRGNISVMVKAVAVQSSIQVTGMPLNVKHCIIDLCGIVSGLITPVSPPLCVDAGLHVRSVPSCSLLSPPASARASAPWL